MSKDGTMSRTFAFVFPMMPGNLNPSLPIARHLCKQGHSVHYLCFKQFQDAICDTGAVFHDATTVESELYATRTPGALGAYEALEEEFGLSGRGYYCVQSLLANVHLELQLPGILRFLEAVKPNAVVYSPTINREAAMGAEVLKLPTIALNSFAGPGAYAAAVRKLCGELGFEELDTLVKAFQPNLDAIHRLNATYGLSLKPGCSYGRLDPLPKLSIVTTLKALRHPEESDLAKAIQEAGADDLYLGPMLDVPGAKRAGGFKMVTASGTEANDTGGYAVSEDEVLAQALAAFKTGRRLVLVSMGTVATGDHPALGWFGRPVDVDGRPCGLSGRELCRAVWGGVFDAFGASTADGGPLLLVVVGPQLDPLGELSPPPNAVCARFAPQVDVLRASPDVFVTHGGQNSFTESLMHGTPVVVCPSFGDQPVNARKAAALGVGLQVERPDPDAGAEAEAAAAYRADVCRALCTLLHEPRFAEAAVGCSERLGAAGGVPRAVELILDAAARPVRREGEVKVLPLSDTVPAAAVSVAGA
mmetsp:Transcript_95355/g.278811  ORF Transcript_95355/g.278811 Transcript_95355/m.278811 type:complete len:532 (-) Transcript_95355:222-1817(-)